MKSIMPFSRDNQKILVHALIRFGETRDESDFRGPSFKIVPRNLKELAVIHPVNIVMREVYTHLFVEGVYTT